MSCAACDAEEDGEEEFDACIHCEALLCPECAEDGCCGEEPAVLYDDLGWVGLEKKGVV